MNGPKAQAYEEQLAARVAELLPGIGTDERLELLGAMDDGDMRASLAFIAAMYPQVFDFALVRDAAMAGRLKARLGEDPAETDPARCPGQPGDGPAALGALLGAVLGEGLSARFARDEHDGAFFVDLVSTTGSQSSGIGRTPLSALAAAAAEYGIGDGPADDDEDQADDDDLEPYCSQCGALIGIFLGQRERGWQHFRGGGTTAAPVEIYDAGHDPALSWAPAGER